MDIRTLQALKKDMSLKNIAAYIFNDDYVSDFLKQDLKKYKLRTKVSTINEELLEKILKKVAGIYLPATFKLILKLLFYILNFFYFACSP